MSEVSDGMGVEIPSGEDCMVRPEVQKGRSSGVESKFDQCGVMSLHPSELSKHEEKRAGGA